MPKADKIEYEKRVRIVQEWILEDWPSCDIVAQILQKKWVTTDRQAKTYLAVARSRWVGEEEVIVANKRRIKIQSLRKLKRSLNDRYKGTPAGIHVVLEVEKEIIKLEGLPLPKKVELTGANGKPIETKTTIKSNVDFSKLSDDVVLALLNATIDNGE